MSLEFAEAESRDQGKPVSLARSVDIPRAIYNFRYFAGKVLYVESKCNEVDGVALNYVHRMPVGVCGLISPWNLPLYLLTWKIAPALAFGNTAVCKPSEITSLTAFMLCQVFKDAGLPNGVLNMVFGGGLKAGSALVSHPQVPLISFTGGTVTGEKITTLAAPYHKKLSLELGGKNANIIFDDADLEKAVEHTVRSSFANQGEICLCGSRIFVHENIYDEFIEKFVSKTKQIKVGDPAAPETNMGPLVSEQHLEKVLSYVKIGVEEGGTILHGSNERLKQEGYYMLPTIIATNKMNPMKCRVTQDEIFGPVVTVTKFSDDDTVVEWANGVKYGLSASIWTENGKRQRRVAEALRVGTVWVNCWMVRDLSMPFGGTKHSGVGREGGDYSLEFYTEEKTICLAN